MEEFDIKNHRHTGTDYPKIRYSDLEGGPSGAYAKLTASSGHSISSSSETIIQFNINEVSSGLTVDTSNYRITVPTTGVYSISALVLWYSTVDNKLYQLRVKKNGTSTLYTGYFSSIVPSGNRYVALFLDTIFSLSANDYIELYGYHNAGTAQTVLNGGDYFSIIKVS